MAFWKGYFTGDIHGSEQTFKKLLKAGKFYDVKAVIVAGDLVGKGMIPIIKEGSTYTCEFGGEPQKMETEDELRKMIGLIDDSGFYHYLTTRDEVTDLLANPEKSERLVNSLLMQRMESWMSQLEESSMKDGIDYYISPGNDDPFCVDPLLSCSKIVVNPEERLVAVHEKIDMLTCGWTNPTPWDTERELPEDQLLDKLEGLVKMVPDVKKCIFSLHAPPYRTKIDVAPNLDKDLRMQSGLNGSPFQNVGSTAVRKVIEKYQPLVAVHGHIHESAGKDKIGNTLCFNPGSEYAQGVLRGIILIFNIDKQAKYVNYLSVSG
ncbi:MAG: metallophosphoesterase [Anaerolineaceae bacterium]|nr:metallophosphoesterase [Anaerolineaceae bacterium]